MKKCSKCKIEKNEGCFNKYSGTKDGLYPSCKNCRKITLSKYYENNSDIIIENTKKYYEYNKSVILVKNKKLYENNKEEILATNRDYYKNNKKAVLAAQKIYRDNHKFQRNEYINRNKTSIKEYNKNYAIVNKYKIVKKHNEYQNKRYNNDPQFRIRNLISSKITKQLKLSGSCKGGGSCLYYLPYTIQELKDHIEKQFEPWMTWNNQGLYVAENWNDNDQTTWKWQLDHIIPASSFNYTSMEDQTFKECWALSNLRPLSAKQNQLDGAIKIRHKKDIL